MTDTNIQLSVRILSRGSPRAGDRAVQAAQSQDPHALGPLKPLSCPAKWHMEF